MEASNPLSLLAPKIDRFQIGNTESQTRDALEAPTDRSVQMNTTQSISSASLLRPPNMLVVSVFSNELVLTPADTGYSLYPPHSHL